jgi:hypothetical protein
MTLYPATGCVIGLMAFAASPAPAQELYSAPRAPISDPEAYAVYGVVLSSRFFDPPFAGATVLVSGHTADYFCDPDRITNQKWFPVIESYRHENKESRQVLAGGPMGRTYVVVDPKLDFIGGNWLDFYDRYGQDSGGWAELSAVGFDATQTRAKVYVGQWCGDRCGKSKAFYLVKHDGQWREVDTKILGNDVDECTTDPNAVVQR